MQKYFTSKDLGEMFAVSSLTIKREYERKKIHGFFVGNELRFSQQDVDDYTCLRENHKTLREIELEEKNKVLEIQLQKMKTVIDSIKSQLLKLY